MTGLAKTIGGNRMSKEKFPDNVVYNYETEEFDANIKPYGTNTAGACDQTKRYVFNQGARHLGS